MFHINDDLQHHYTTEIRKSLKFDYTKGQKVLHIFTLKYTLIITIHLLDVTLSGCGIQK